MAQSKNYKTTYFNDEQVKYIDEYLINFSDWVKVKIQKEMDNTPGYCLETIEKKKLDVKHWEERLKLAQKAQHESEKALKKLVHACINRTTEQRKAYLTGVTGQLLLRVVKMSRPRFIKYLEGYKGD